MQTLILLNESGVVQSLTVTGLQHRNQAGQVWEVVGAESHAAIALRMVECLREDRSGRSDGQKGVDLVSQLREQERELKQTSKPIVVMTDNPAAFPQEAAEKLRVVVIGKTFDQKQIQAALAEAEVLTKKPGAQFLKDIFKRGNEAAGQDRREVF